jgi:hypothetical protein
VIIFAVARWSAMLLIIKGMWTLISNRLLENTYTYVTSRGSGEIRVKYLYEIAEGDRASTVTQN